jgi:hypothetical protein
MVDFFILGLATLRLANMLSDVEQGGPWDMLTWFRIKSGVRFDQESKPYGTTSLARGILCPFCNSMWFGILFTIGYVLVPDATLFVALPFSLSAIAILPYISNK